MSGNRGSSVPAIPPRPEPAPSPRVRGAKVSDAPAVAVAVEELLLELGGERPSTAALEAAARQLIQDPDAGVLLLAEGGGQVVGVLAASWQHAIHVPGRYGTVQDLWVHRAWRGRAVGHRLLEALVAIARVLEIDRLEVGLPQESFDQIAATERFYLGNGFQPLGPRMRRLLR
jgi:GNAT superfamily N-acetyltransferase